MRYNFISPIILCIIYYYYAQRPVVAIASTQLLELNTTQRYENHECQEKEIIGNKIYGSQSTLCGDDSTRLYSYKWFCFSQNTIPKNHDLSNPTTT